VRDFVPKPLPDSVVVNNQVVSDEVTARFGMFELPFSIQVDAVDLYCQTHGRNSFIWCACYTEDGQRQLWNARSSSITGVGTFTITIPSVQMVAGQYWIAFVGGTDALPAPAVNITCYDTTTTRTVVDALAAGVFSYLGTMVVAAHTLPATFVPATDITAAHDVFPQCRFRDI